MLAPNGAQSSSRRAFLSPRPPKHQLQAAQRWPSVAWIEVFLSIHPCASGCRDTRMFTDPFRPSSQSAGLAGHHRGVTSTGDNVYATISRLAVTVDAERRRQRAGACWTSLWGQQSCTSSRSGTPCDCFNQLSKLVVLVMVCFPAE